MAISLNGGTGVITGVSVGGLPDGVVDSGTLATNSVDSAQLVSGAVDLAHLSATGTAGSGTVNTGSGGGGTKTGTSGAGGSGVVILRMPTASYSGTTSGSPTVSTDSSDTILIFNASGSYTG